MGLFKANRAAAVTLTALLAGCASTAPVQQDATLLSPAAKPLGFAGSMKEAATAGVEPALDLEGAVRQAQAQRKMGDLTGATRTLSQLVLFAPDDPRVLGEYGKTLVAQGRSDDALAFLERAIELQSNDWSLYSAQGVAYDQKGQYVAAQASYGRALALKPGEPTVLSNDALSHIQSGDLDEAERLLQQAAQAGGDYPRIASNLALVQSLKSSHATAVPPAPPVAIDMNAMTAPPVAAVEMQPEAASVAPVTVTNAPVESAPLTSPKTASSEPAAQPQPVTAPRVVMQKVPVDPLAGPVVPKAKAVKTAAKKTQQTEISLLRPTLDGDEATRQASAEQ